ncbi:MAG TPA: hypothetical protein VF597_00595 [Candidatus Saccharimonadales bacterium]|jgi:hypothetical protein
MSEVAYADFGRRSSELSLRDEIERRRRIENGEFMMSTSTAADRPVVITPAYENPFEVPGVANPERTVNSMSYTSLRPETVPVVDDVEAAVPLQIDTVELPEANETAEVPGVEPIIERGGAVLESVRSLAETGFDTDDLSEAERAVDSYNDEAVRLFSFRIQDEPAAKAVEAYFTTRLSHEELPIDAIGAVRQWMAREFDVAEDEGIDLTLAEFKMIDTLADSFAKYKISEETAHDIAVPIVALAYADIAKDNLAAIKSAANLTVPSDYHLAV